MLLGGGNINSLTALSSTQLLNKLVSTFFYLFQIHWCTSAEGKHFSCCIMDQNTASQEADAASRARFSRSSRSSCPVIILVSPKVHLQRDGEESKDASVLAEEAQLHEAPAADHQVQELRSPADTSLSRKEVSLFHCSARHPEPLLPPPSQRWICDSTPTFLRRDNIIAHTWLPLTARLWLLERLIELYYLHQMSHRIILLKLCLTHLPIPL